MTASVAALDTDGDYTVLRFGDDLDLATAPDLMALASAALTRTDMRTLVVDMTGVEFIDSTGINGLVQIRELCLRSRVEFGLRGLNPRVCKVLALTGLNPYFGVPDGDGGRC